MEVRGRLSERTLSPETGQGPGIGDRGWEESVIITVVSDEL